MKKSGLAVLVALLSYTLVDIMIWQRIFESNRLINFAYLYHPGWYVMLGGEIVLGAVLLLPNWRATLFYVGALASLAMCGLEDVLYYWLDRRPIPYYLPWLEVNPWIFPKPVTSHSLLLSVSIWVGLTVLAFWYLHRRESALPRQPHPLPEMLRADLHAVKTNAQAVLRESAPRRQEQLPVTIETLDQET